VSRGGAAADDTAGAFRVRPARATVHALHGPARDGVGLWPDPHGAAVGSPRAAQAWEGTGGAEGPATERWEHGLLVAVATPERRAALGALWGESRVAGARIGAVEAAAPEARDLAAMAALGRRGWLRPLARAFEHVGAKAAWVGALDADLGAPHASALAALREARTRPRLAALERWLVGREAAVGEDAEVTAWGFGDAPESPPAWRGAWVALERLDRALDAYGGGRSWFMARVPAHCRALWPLRNLMRLADRAGAVLAEMRFGDYEALEAFAPELPVLCLDREIYGGGFDHDLFHRLCPVPRTGDPRADAWGLLAIESAAQAYNGLVFDSRHLPPVYDGHARWRGWALFESLERDFGLTALSEQLAAFRILGLICHPRFGDDPVATWSRLCPNPVSPAAIDRLMAQYGRYVRLDAAWLDALHARYETPAFAAFSDLLDDRFAPTLAATFAAIDAMVSDSEDVDLRTIDLEATGRAAEGAQTARWLAQKSAELRHLTERAGAHPLAATLELGALEGEARAHTGALGALSARAAALSACRPSARPSTAALDGDIAASEASLAQLGHRLDRAILAIRDAQRAGLGGPPVPADFRTAVRELFHGVDCAPPVHVGADSPGLP
jgi:hypothetical protein